MAVPVTTGSDGVAGRLDDAGVVVDALVGCGLSGPPRGRVRDLVAACTAISDETDSDTTDGDRSDREGADADRSGRDKPSQDAPGRVLSLDVPSGVDATTGETPGVAVRPDRTLTLALPKTGLAGVPGDLELADLAIPAVVFRRADVEYRSPFDGRYRVPLERTPTGAGE